MKMKRCKALNRRTSQVRLSLVAAALRLVGELGASFLWEEKPAGLGALQSHGDPLAPHARRTPSRTGIRSVNGCSR